MFPLDSLLKAHLERRYGWFWECPNGESCHYRHALPPGFVLKSQKKALEDAEKANAISLEEFLEVEVRIHLADLCFPVMPTNYRTSVTNLGPTSRL